MARKYTKKYFQEQGAKGGKKSGQMIKKMKEIVNKLDPKCKECGLPEVDCDETYNDMEEKCPGRIIREAEKKGEIISEDSRQD